MSFPMPEKDSDVADGLSKRRDPTTGGGLNFKVEPISSRLASTRIHPSCSAARCTAIPTRRWCAPTWATPSVSVCYRRWPTRRWSGRCRAIPISPSDMPAMPIGKIPSTSALPSGTTSSCPRPRTAAAARRLHPFERSGVEVLRGCVEHRACWTRRCRTFRSCRQAIAVEMKFRNRLGSACRCSGEGLQRGRDGLSGDEVESNAPDVIEVDFERTIKMVNPGEDLHLGGGLPGGKRNSTNAAHVACKRR